MNARAVPVWDLWPDGISWQPMSPTLRTVWVLRSLLNVLILAVIAAVPLTIWLGWDGLLWALGGYVVLAGLRALAVSRTVRTWGYAERDQDLLVRHGLLTRRLSIVPYGRIQLIDLSAGPVERMFGLTTVQVRTAALGSNTEVPGLDPLVAAALRDRLAVRAAEVREGL
ncbi:MULTISPECIES: PH domain-containing protein [Glycomyces]|uniref:Membrane protein YdbS with pleckstrin-like domain n=2 Tax=Glycomyces TaxID=58113 RepID=A0A9X3PNC9_9ACTN|nr:PH domain-containing protein [Glycomyces lechevalierae]MDA1387094.1 PH domain-containing protein [Glycomyces lechevalierae]MDR7336877.1 membrane protein YdbS with pleckstrin-like domain [Glycomyces lechevalierae]